MIKMTVLYNYDKAVAKLSKVYGVSKQTVKDHFDDMNVEVFYQTRKAFGRDYLYWMIKQSDIEECRQWLNTHSKELAKDEAKRVRNSNGYVLDNHKDEPLHFNTQREIADFLGYKNVGFVIGKVYRGYELKSEEPLTSNENSDETTTETTSAENSSSVPLNNSIINTNTGKSVTNHTIVKDNTSIDIASHENQPLDTTVDNSDKSMYTQKSFEENLNYNTEVESNETIVNDNTSIDIARSEDENQPLDITSIPEHQPFVLGDLDPKPEPKQESKPTPKSDFEAKLDAYFEKYYGGIC